MLQKLEPTQAAATLCFAFAILHTFLVKRFQHLAKSYPEGSALENFFHLLGEVEVVFGLWAAIFFGISAAMHGTARAIHYLESLNFTEPAFVFVILSICSTRPILHFAASLIELLSKALPFKHPLAFYITALSIGPLLGSFITEPAAMTVTALILLDRFYSQGISNRLKYATLGLLFVNVSIGGTLTPYAAPPVLMVAAKWKWDLVFMLTHFGWKAATAVVSSTVAVAFVFRHELAGLPWKRDAKKNSLKLPSWVVLTHLFFLVLIVATAHHMVVFAGLFLFFLGLVSVTREYQENLRLKEGLLVAFFLGGLIVLGGPQRWWLEPLITKLDVFPLYLGSAALTAVTDNAALTYLGSQVPSLSDLSKYSLVAGSVVGGGLTVIANAPNPVGFGLLNSSFGKEGISPLGLFLAALFPTFVALALFWIH